jgi:hypothetical protein
VVNAIYGKYAFDLGRVTIVSLLSLRTLRASWHGFCYCFDDPYRTLLHGLHVQFILLGRADYYLSTVELYVQCVTNWFEVLEGVEPWLGGGDVWNTGILILYTHSEREVIQVNGSIFSNRPSL